MSDQLQLFGLPPEKRGRVRAAQVPSALRELAARLPSNLRFGTSSWSFPGWEGLVYDRPASSAALAKDGLAAYAQHPLFRTVGVDRGYYAPIPREALEGYARVVPPDFRFLVKGLGEVTAPLIAPERARGALGLENPRFLDAEFAARAVIEPLSALGELLGVLLFQFPPLDVGALGGPIAFADRLHRFASALPRGPRYAFELRSRAALSPHYAAALSEVGAIHCLNLHPTMPPPREQVERLGEAYVRAPAVVVRWMLHGTLRYQAAKERYAPFDRLVDADPESRDHLAELLSSEGRPTWVVINNKAEGSSPRSVAELAKRIAERGSSA